MNNSSIYEFARKGRMLQYYLKILHKLLYGKSLKNGSGNLRNVPKSPLPFGNGL